MLHYLPPSKCIPSHRKHASEGTEYGFRATLPMAHRDEKIQPHFAFVLGHASLSVNGNPSNSITGSIRLTAVVLRTPLYMMPPFRKTPNSPSKGSGKKHINQRSRTNPFILWDPLLLPRSIDTAACPRVLSCNTKCCPNIKYGRDDGHGEDGAQRSSECWYHEKSVVSATAEG